MMTAHRPVTLTPRQQEVAVHIAAGLTAPEVAARLECSVHTVRVHLKAIAMRLPHGPGTLRHRIYTWARENAA